MSCECNPIALGVGRLLRFNCAGCRHGSSIEKSESCMRGVVKKLAENPNVESVILAGVYEREYSGPSLEALKELAHIFGEFRYGDSDLVIEECKLCETDRKHSVQEIIELLPQDPVQARFKLIGLVAETRAKVNRGAKQCRRCRKIFLEKLLKPMLLSLEKIELAKGQRKNRVRYAEILRPRIRPCFMSSRISTTPPSGAELIDAYDLDGNEVRVYLLPDELQHLYFLIPLEYRFPPGQVSLIDRVRRSLLEHSPENSNFSESHRAREYLKHLARSFTEKFAAEGKLGIEKGEIETLAECLAKYTAGLGVLETLLSDPRVQDVYVDAPVGKSPVHIYHRDFEECTTNIFLTPGGADSLISKFRAESGRPFSEADPVMDLNFGGVRISAIGNPLSPDGLAFALRKFKPTPWTIPQFMHNRFLNSEAAGLLGLLVDSQASILITGSRSAGKTSLLSSLMLEILPKFRILCLEDTAELPIAKLREIGFKVQSLRVQSAVTGSDVELKAEDALRSALRLGESVLVVGECRGREVKALYEAMRVGAAGNSVMGTIHGSTVQDVFERVVYDLGIPPSSFKATDVVVVAAPIRPKGSINRVRRITQITEVVKEWNPSAGKGEFLDLMSYDPVTDELKPSAALTKLRSQLIRSIARKWGTKPAEVLQNLRLRARIFDTLVGISAKLGKPEWLEAEFVVRSNLEFHRLMEEQLRHKAIDYGEIYERWNGWLHIFGNTQGCVF